MKGSQKYVRVATSEGSAESGFSEEPQTCDSLTSTPLRKLCVICLLVALMLTLLTLHMSGQKSNKSSSNSTQSGAGGGGDSNSKQMNLDWDDELVANGKGYSKGTDNPTEPPSMKPTTAKPTSKPSKDPSVSSAEMKPTSKPMNPTNKPSKSPSAKPSDHPTMPPSKSPTQPVIPPECELLKEWYTDHCKSDISVMRPTKGSWMRVLDTDKGKWHLIQKPRKDLAYFSSVTNENSAGILRGNYVCNATQSKRAVEVASRVWIPSTCDTALSFDDRIELMPPNFTAIILGNSYINQLAQSFAQRSLLRGELDYVETYGDRCVRLIKRDDYVPKPGENQTKPIEQSTSELSDKDNHDLDLFDPSKEKDKMKHDTKDEQSNGKLDDLMETTHSPELNKESEQKKGQRRRLLSVKSDSAVKGRIHSESFTLLSGKYDLEFSYGSRGCPKRVNLTPDGTNVESETGAPQLQMYHFKNGGRLLNIKNTPWMCLESREVLRLIEIVLKWTLNPPKPGSSSLSSQTKNKKKKEDPSRGMNTGFKMDNVDLFLMNDGNLIQWMIDDLTKDDPYFHDVCLSKQKTTDQYAVMDLNQFRTVLYKELNYHNQFIDAPSRYVQFAEYRFDLDFVHMITGKKHKYEQNSHRMDENRTKHIDEAVGRYCQSDWPSKDPDYQACLDHLGHQCTPGNPDSYAEVFSVDCYLTHCHRLHILK